MRWRGTCVPGYSYLVTRSDGVGFLQGISDAFYCFECTRLEKDRDGCPKIINLGSSRTDLFYQKKSFRNHWALEHCYNVQWRKPALLSASSDVLWLRHAWRLWRTGPETRHERVSLSPNVTSRSSFGISQVTLPPLMPVRKLPAASYWTFMGPVCLRWPSMHLMKMPCSNEISKGQELVVLTVY